MEVQELPDRSNQNSSFHFQKISQGISEMAKTALSALASCLLLSVTIKAPVLDRVQVNHG